LSSGLTNRALTTPADRPSFSRMSAASSAFWTNVPMATMVRSFPSRRISPLAIGRRRSSVSRGVPVPLPRGYRMTTGPGWFRAVLSMCWSSFSSFGDMTVKFGISRVKDRSKVP